MFRKRIGDQSESKIDSDKIPAKKDRARFAGPLRGAVCLNTLLNAVSISNNLKLTIVCFRTFTALFDINHHSSAVCNIIKVF